MCISNVKGVFRSYFYRQNWCPEKFIHAEVKHYNEFFLVERITLSKRRAKKIYTFSYKPFLLTIANIPLESLVKL